MDSKLFTRLFITLFTISFLFQIIWLFFIRINSQYNIKFIHNLYDLDKIEWIFSKKRLY